MSITEGVKYIWESGVEVTAPVISFFMTQGSKLIGVEMKPNEKPLPPVPTVKIMPFNRNVIRMAGMSGMFAVALGAYGAHKIIPNEKYPEDRKISYRTANMYHFFGTFGLIACSLSKYPYLSASLMCIGTMIFSSACYHYALTGNRDLSWTAPYGGMTIMCAWLSLCL